MSNWPINAGLGDGGSTSFIGAGVNADFVPPVISTGNFLITAGLGRGSRSSIVSLGVGSNGNFEPVLPNPLCTITPMVPGWSGLSFPTVWQQQEQVFTFDVSALIDPGDSINGLLEFSLTPSDPFAAMDTTPSARVRGVATRTGNLISQRYGNWQTLDSSITYQIAILFRTRLGYITPSVSFVDVLPLPTGNWSDA